MTDAELRSIKAEADGDCSNCFALLAEVRALRAERDDASRETERIRRGCEILREHPLFAAGAIGAELVETKAERNAARADAARLRERLEAVLRRFCVGHTSTVDGCNECDEAAKIRAALAATTERTPT